MGLACSGPDLLGATHVEHSDDRRYRRSVSSSSGGPKNGSAAPWEQAGLSEATVFDLYEIGTLLGSGFFGQVRVCSSADEHDKQKYAVKIVDTKGEVFKQAAAHLSARTEAAVLKAVRHPHIVELYDCFEQERWLFLVMEYISGGELFSALANPRLNVTESVVAHIGGQLLEALHHLHEHFVVHRDVKAENILLDTNPLKTGEWHIKLVDFGLALRVERPSCIFNMTCRDQAPLEELICGTAYYCAPEVWVNDYGPKVDVWAAGVVMYLALLGRFPFYDQDAGVLEAMICNPMEFPAFEPVKAKESEHYQVSMWARDCLEQLLQKDSQHRPTAQEALNIEWLQKGLNFEGGGNFQDHRSASMRSDAHLLNMGDQPIPAVVRVKAGKAAARPAVDPDKERLRSTALECLKERAQAQSQLKRGLSVSRLSEATFDGVVSRTSSRQSESHAADLSYDFDAAQQAESGLSCSEFEVDDSAMCVGCTRVGMLNPDSR
eukprot:TRINITY_DN59753_c0_g1_i1.p1 TRINITY_DN59753_c0_g1~~TRINITY_DN59753_c0_g1_i1.p1  ORF type:complete len:492 (+),score=126.58 TRINITY_DN59753_c0_g1_i1:72-1547(+)